MFWVNAKSVPDYIRSDLTTAKIKKMLEKAKFEYDTYEYILNIDGYAVKVKCTYQWSDKRGMKWDVEKVGKFTVDGNYVNYWFN